jgi:hypothetical protein
LYATKLTVPCLYIISGLYLYVLDHNPHAQQTTTATEVYLPLSRSVSFSMTVRHRPLKIQECLTHTANVISWCNRTVLMAYEPTCMLHDNTMQLDSTTLYCSLPQVQYCGPRTLVPSYCEFLWVIKIQYCCRRFDCVSE